MVIVLIVTLGEWGAQFNLFLKIILCLTSFSLFCLTLNCFKHGIFLFSLAFVHWLTFSLPLSRHPDTQEESGCLVFWVWVQRRPVVFRTLSYRRTERCWSSSSTPSSTATNRVELKKLSRHSFTKLTHFTVQCVYRAAVRPHFHWYYTHNVFTPWCELKLHILILFCCASNGYIFCCHYIPSSFISVLLCNINCTVYWPFYYYYKVWSIHFVWCAVLALKIMIHCMAKKIKNNAR